ncbi:phosphate/phosphite/phosphonate ABC transporter substrate-binding protein [Roseovarius pelagicus]|uniref:Phosphate/phosphite/phosphonate ABC transporter substrate-binding protein n=1 Tax=Roseovarius pelagicus TaxID=2980108 RepID=A0ABY6DFR4_9RHOB|nr:phosphate/phosphite/phosphonate ABC transporter substrate-binding protein [Roseovarius pelagicus]UXX84048.1 phosphate/phosphite/phosphonate ABC transporter substrate-binding protein [Roseovarius pelagicus]
MIASLPMYDRPETRAANDALWAGIRAQLSEAAPPTLTRGGDLWKQWQNPDLILSQTCGYPYRSRLHGQVQLVGSPVHDLPGCPPGHYNSVIIARVDDPRADPTDFADAPFAYNEALSQSGWAAPQNYAAAHGFRFCNPVQSGGHIASARAVAEGRADIAAIDALTWLLITRHDAFAAGLREITRTPPTPILPYITAHGRDADALAGVVSSAIAALPALHRETLALTGLARIPAAHYLSVPNPPPPAPDTPVLD